MAAARTDVIIVGGGPAGASAAIVLARLGYAVTVVDRAHFPRPRIGASLPPKIDGLLAILGVLPRVQQAGFARMRGTVVDQGAGLLFHEFDPEAGRRGYQVDRALFDAILLDEAARAGASVQHGVTAVSLLYEQGRVSGLRVKQGQGERCLPAAWVIDASGSAAWGARASGLGQRDVVRTVALCGYWKQSRLPTDFEPYSTLFEFMPDGWIWSLLRQDGVRNVTVALDPDVLKGAGDPQEVYLQKVRASRLVGALIAEAELQGEVGRHDASWRNVQEYAQPGLLFVGDAASVIDPLTSQGVFKAIQSGIVASAVVNTALARPDDEAMALDYYRESQRRFFDNYAEIARSSYRASPYLAEEFWQKRVRAHVATPEEFSADSVEEQARRRLEFRQAVTTEGGLRLALRAAPNLSVELRSVTQGGFVVRQPTFVVHDIAVDGGGIDPERLLPLLNGQPMASVFDGYAAAVEQAPSVGLGRALMNVLSALVAAGAVQVQRVS